MKPVGNEGAAVRDRMVDSARFLLAREGFAATSFAAVLKHAEAPRGSVYYHFPGGKDELVSAAVTTTVEHWLQVVRGLRGQGVAENFDALTQEWRGVLVRSDCQSGCPIMAVSIGAGVSDSLHATAGEALAKWQSALAENLRIAGLTKKRSAELAVYLVAGWEGAVMIARAARSLKKFDAVTATMRTVCLSA